ncbi:MAG: GspH/FimT family pseudopilin [Thiobacillus sp.]|nr:GspH/FimT family pseudopilin [Thiobacillus sp.]
MKQSGTTLLELMVVLAVSAILLTIGIPSFASFASNNRLAGATNALVSSLHLARSEAIKRNGRAVLCKSASGVACSASGDWQQGWIVFHDANNNAVLDAGEALILTHSALPSGLLVTATGSFSNYISYAPMGAARLISGTWQFGNLTLCQQSPDQGGARKIVISSTGRVRTVKLAACP